MNVSGSQWLDLILNVDQSLGVWIAAYGPWVYLVLFLIVFAETGLVVFPFLPGDSLLFIAGAFAATGHLNAWLLGILLLGAAVAGNTVNYAIGRYFGARIMASPRRWIDADAVRRTHRFYDRHGGKTLILARFAPVVRTFAPFVAGLGVMPFARFQFFNVLGALFWVAILVVCGFYFGNLPIVRDHLNTIVFIGLGAAIVPVLFMGLWRFLKPRRSSTRQNS